MYSHLFWLESGGLIFLIKICFIILFKLRHLSFWVEVGSKICVDRDIQAFLLSMPFHCPPQYSFSFSLLLNYALIFSGELFFFLFCFTSEFQILVANILFFICFCQVPWVSLALDQPYLTYWWEDYCIYIAHTRLDYGTMHSCAAHRRFSYQRAPRTLLREECSCYFLWLSEPFSQFPIFSSF